MEVVEVVANVSVFVPASRLEVVPEDLREQHLAHSDHAPPSSIGHEGCLVAIVP